MNVLKIMKKIIQNYENILEYGFDFYSIGYTWYKKHIYTGWNNDNDQDFYISTYQHYQMVHDIFHIF